MNPFVQGLRWHRLWIFKSLLIPLQEESVILGDLCDSFRLQEVQINLILREFGIFSFFCLHDQSLLEISLSTQDRGQGVVFVLAFKELKTLTAA